MHESRSLMIVLAKHDGNVPLHLFNQDLVAKAFFRVRRRTRAC
jgi:hypothetical protein